MEGAAASGGAGDVLGHRRAASSAHLSASFHVCSRRRRAWQTLASSEESQRLWALAVKDLLLATLGRSTLLVCGGACPNSQHFDK